MRRLSLIIEDEKCWGCKTCEVVCKQEINVPDGVKLIAVEEEGPEMIGNQPFFQYRLAVCRHCDDPACADVCSEAAIRKRDDGIVVLDQACCSGCQSCIDACPYDAIDFDTENRVAYKCNLCSHRVDRGLMPACADNICLAHCIYFGDAEELVQGS